MGEINYSIDELIEKISDDKLLNHIKVLSQWERLSGSDDEKKAFDYIERVLGDIGINYTRYFANCYISIPLDSYLTYKGKRIKADAPSMSAKTTVEGISAQAVLVNSKMLDIRNVLDLENKIAVIEGLAMPNIIEYLKASKCVGAVFIQSGEYISKGILSPIWGSPSILDSNLLPDIPVISINKKDGEDLIRYLEGDNNIINISIDMDNGWREIPILISDIKSSTVDTDDYVLFSGHLDSWYYGAMDNGSANATMLEIARLVKENQHLLKRNLRLAFWSGHSHGRYAGSAWYADEFWQDIYENCYLHVNVDSVGAKNANIITEAHVMKQTEIIGNYYVEKIANQTLSGTRVGRAGDQSFWAHGIPSLFLTLSEQPPLISGENEFAKIVGGSNKTSGLGWWWHTSEDTIDKIDKENLRRDALIYASCIFRYCMDSIIPMNLSRAVDEIAIELGNYQNIAGDFIDIQGLINKAIDLNHKLTDLNKYLDKSFVESTAQRINKVIKAINRELILISYVKSDMFHQDLALNYDLIPSLSILKQLNINKNPDEINEILVEARRCKNKILYHLTNATNITDELVNFLS